MLGQARQDVDLIVSGGIVVTMDGSRAIYQDGSVAVRGDAIVAVGPRADIEAKYHGAQTIDARGRLVLPGFINGHTHVPMTLFRGLHDDVTLNDWLYKYIFPAEAKNVNEEFVRWGTTTGGGGADPVGRDHVRGYVLLRGRGCGRDEGGGNAGCAGRDVYRFSRAR